MRIEASRLPYVAVPACTVKFLSPMIVNDSFPVDAVYPGIVVQD